MCTMYMDTLTTKYRTTPTFYYFYKNVLGCTHRIKDDRMENFGAYIGFISK